MKYDAFQEKAIDYINQGHSVIVSAPTGAGKTVIAEHVINDCLEKNQKVIYTAPIKALSNQKFREFSENFKDKIGILTGDVTINAHAQVLIMTTEIFRNKILEEKTTLKNYSWIIFDEIHFIDDIERGSVWEESLMFLPDHMNVLGLSATIPNVDELAGWFKSIHDRTIKIVKESKRPVPLHFFYQCQNNLYDKFDALIKQGYRTGDYVASYGKKIPSWILLKPNRLSSLINQLIESDKLPCIYFAFSRRKTEELAGELLHYDFLNMEEREKIRKLFLRLLERFDLVGDPAALKIKPFIDRGIAYHHAGMLPTLKNVVEELFTSRLIKVIFTTETFALGINMPARTVIFDELRKYYGRSFDFLKTRDFFQMAGRAGRRSIDTEGFVISRVNPHYMSVSSLEKIVYSEPEKVYSRFNAGYATILNLYQKYNEKIYDIYPLSFHYYQEKKFSRKRAIATLREKVSLLKNLGYIRRNQITSKGYFASKVYGYELLLSELYEDGTLDNYTELDLGVLAVSLVYEPRKRDTMPELDSQIKRIEKVTDKLINEIHAIEKKSRISPRSKRCYFHITPIFKKWINNCSFAEILKDSDIDEGEIIRYFRMSVQILRDISDANISDSLNNRIKNLIPKINRDIVDSEKQLRS